MRIVIQRVSRASVLVDGKQISAIGKGLCILAGFEPLDETQDMEWLAKKIVQCRIFDDDSGIMNESVQDIDGEILLVSQFTLYASTRKGNRPSYSRASPPGQALGQYKEFVSILSKALGKNIMTGEFGARMNVSLVNEGPVTILMDSKQRELTDKNHFEKK
jgi:D-aminoacyl-tRNA deacylase